MIRAVGAPRSRWTALICSHAGFLKRRSTISLSPWLSWPLSWSHTRRGQRRNSPSRWKNARFSLEPLEGRALLASYTAAGVSDLIADITDANTNGGANTITLKAATTAPYVLTTVDNTTDGATGLPVIAANDNLTIDGGGDTIERSIVSGTPDFRLFDVAIGASLSLQSLALQGGSATGAGVSAEGGAIFSQGALTLTGVTVQNNQAVGIAGVPGLPSSPAGPGGNAFGGGLYVAGGTAALYNATLSSNTALGGAGGPAASESTHIQGTGGNAFGGSLEVAGGTVTLSGDTLSSNVAQGGHGGNGIRDGNEGAGDGGNGYGGALQVSGGTASVFSSTLSFNTAEGGDGLSVVLLEADGFGGALQVNGGTVSLTSATLSSNTAQGLSGYGGALQVNSGTVSLTSATLSSNTALGGNNAYIGGYGSGEDGIPYTLSEGGYGDGGALQVNGGVVSLTGATTVSSNTAQGGYGYYGGDGNGGALQVSDGSVSLTGAILSSNTAQAGSGFGYGGYGYGGALQVSGGTVTLGTAALSSNTAQGGDCTTGENGYAGNGNGGALEVSGGTVSLTFTTVSANTAQGGTPADDGGFGSGGGLFISHGTVYLDSFTIAHTTNNADSTGTNGSSANIDGGYTESIPVLQSIAVTPANPSIPKGETEQFTATGTYSDDCTQNLTSQVTWASATPSVATISKASGSQGLATGVMMGTTTISATLNGVTSSTVLTVSAAVLQSIAVAPANPSVPKGETEQFTATGTYSDNSTQNLTSQVAWTSATPSVTTISNASGSQGLATGVAMGPSTISATLNGVTGSSVLTVSAAVLRSIAVSPANPSVPSGETEQLTATGTYSDSSTQNLTSQVTWASATRSAVTISSAAGTQGLATAVAPGTSTISATLNGVAGSTVLTVSAAVLQSIAVSPANPTVPNGETEHFTATGTYSDNSTQNLTSQVTWAAATPSVATISNASGSQGLATGVAMGPSTISATLNGVTGSIVLTVSAAVLQSIAVTPANPSVPDGETEQFAATGTYSDNSTQILTSEVTWASATTPVATISSASGTQGLATGMAMGPCMISATLNGVTGSTVLTVSAPVLQSIAVSPANPTVPKGETERFTATGTYSDNFTQNLTSQVTWVSATTSVATISSASGTQGLATGVAMGPATISGTLNGVAGSTVLTVSAAVLQSIAVSPANPSVPKGETDQCTATGTYSDNSTQNLTSQVTWASATTSVATISSASGTQGLATAATAGTSTISATLNGVAGSSVLTVSAAVLRSIAVTPASPSVPKGETDQFTATGTYSDNSTQNLTSQVTWASTTPSVATMSNTSGSQGLATGVAIGRSTISATLSGVAGSSVLMVSAAVFQSIAVTPANPSLPKGEPEQFTATGTYSDNTTQNLTSQVTWASATASVATISNTAGSQGVATATGPGTSTISATLNGVAGSTVLTVSAAVLRSIAVTPANPSVPKGETEQFTATGTYSDNSKENLTTQVEWASATPSVATITAVGLATGVATGMTVIDGTFDGITGNTELTVTRPVAPAVVSLAGVLPIFNRKHLLTEIVVTFSGAVGADEAQQTGLYRLTTPGKHGSFTARNAGIIKLRSAVYSKANDTVALKPKNAFALSKPIQLQINGTPPSGLLDSFGRFINGGNNAVAVLAKSGVTISP